MIFGLLTNPAPLQDPVNVMQHGVSK